jgi:hypothetical protein
MKDINVNEIAENLRRVISRLLKILKNQTKNDELLSLTERSTLAFDISIFRNTSIGIGGNGKSDCSIYVTNYQ